MTKREQNLWLAVAVAAIISLGYFLMQAGTGFSRATLNTPNSKNEIREAYRLLSSTENIKARHRAVLNNLAELSVRFLASENPDLAQIQLLKEVENIAAACNLAVQNKNTLKFSDQEVGVALEGKASSEAVISFIHQISNSQMALIIKRLQLHSSLEKRSLSYQIVLSTHLIKREGK